MTDHLAPQREAFPSAGEWLDAWVRHRIEARSSAAVRLPGVEDIAVYLHGSIGYDCAITLRGEVWVNESDFNGTDACPEKLATGRVEGSDRVPRDCCKKSPRASGTTAGAYAFGPACPACKGTGQHSLRMPNGDLVVPVPGMICLDCSGLGWLAG